MASFFDSALMGVFAVQDRSGDPDICIDTRSS